MARTAERGLFDAFFLGEGLRLREVDGRIHDLDVAGRPDAITQLAALAAVTDRIGLVATSNTTFNEAPDLARRLSGLDLLSEGRAGWNVVTTDNAWTGENFRRGGYLDHADRYRAPRSSSPWPAPSGTAGRTAPPPAPRAPPPGRRPEPSAESGTGTAVRRRPRADPAALRPGPPGDLPGRRLGRGPGLRRPQRRRHLLRARHDFDDALAFADDVRRRLLSAGRPEDDLRILPGTEIIIGATEEEALEKKRWIRLQQVTPRHGVGHRRTPVEP